MTWLLRLMVLAVALVGNGCAQGCDTVLVPGINITVVDGATGNAFEGDLTVTATEGSYAETSNLPAPPGGPRIMSLAYERPGTYRVEIQAAGYETWVRTNVRVIRNDCHVETVLLTAELVPSGTG